VWEKGRARQLTGDRISRQPSWSPDGKRIAHVKIDVNSSEIWVMDADGSNSRQLTHSYDPILTKNNWVFRPVWWPDASRLLFVTEEGTNDLMVWQIGLDGKNRRPFLTVPDGDGGLDMPAISPDGKRLALISYRGPALRSQVWTYGLSNGPWRQLTETSEGAYDPAWSPDGTRIAYAVRNAGKHDLWVMDADGGNQRQLTTAGGCRAPCWSPDGQQLAYLAVDGNAFDLWAMPAPAKAVEAAAGSVAPIASPAANPTNPAPAVRLTRGAQIDAVSGLSWTK
jgi:TolB protein